MVKEMKEFLGKEMVLRSGMGSVLIFVQIQDIREVYGKTQALVSPMAGAGEAWVNLSSLVERS